MWVDAPQNVRTLPIEPSGPKDGGVNEDELHFSHAAKRWARLMPSTTIQGCTLPAVSKAKATSANQKSVEVRTVEVHSGV